MACPVPGLLPDSPASKEYNGGFMSELMLKDMQIAAESAKSVGAKLDFVDKTVQVYEELQQKGFGKKDFGYAFAEKRKR